MPTTFEKTWQFDMGRTFNAGAALTNAKNALWYMKAFLKGEIGGAATGLWTCAGSSDSVTAAMDGTDRWTSTFTPSKLVFDNDGSAHSWIVLQAPAGIGATLYMVLDYNHNGVPQHLSLWFASQPFTGGSTTNRPTSPDEWTASGNNWVQATFHDGTATNWVVNGAMTTEGSFHFLMNSVGASDIYSSIMCHKMSEIRSEDTVPIVVYFNSGGSVYSRPTTSINNQPKIALRGGNDSVSSLDAGFLTWLDSGGNVFLETMSTDSVTGNYDDLPVPVVVWSPVNMRSIRGRLADIRWCPQSLANGTVEPSTGSPVSMVINDFWFPCNAVPIL